MPTIDTEPLKLIVSIAAAAISIMAACLAWVAARRGRVIQILTFLQKHYADIRTWADQVVEAMSEAVFLCDLDPAKTASPEQARWESEGMVFPMALVLWSQTRATADLEEFLGYYMRIHSAQMDLGS